MSSFGEFRIAKADGRTMRLRAQKIFWRDFCSTKWRVGDDGCAIFLCVKKTRHSIYCPFSYLLRKLTTYECFSFSYPQNRPVLHKDCRVETRNDKNDGILNKVPMQQNYTDAGITEADASPNVYMKPSSFTKPSF